MTPAEESEYRLQRKSARPYLAAVAHGIKNDVPARSIVRMNALPPGGMGANTGLPIAIVAEMLADGLVRGHGVFTPEAAVDCEEFFRRLAPLCETPLGGKPLIENIIESAT
jgi:saccharopine dehydrogenase-like NADP-dependent oxidoreductase